MPFQGDSPNRPEEAIMGKHSKEAQSNDRRSFQTALNKVGIPIANHVVESTCLLIKLAADTANQPITVRRQLAE